MRLRRRQLAGLAVAVALTHLWLAGQLWPARLGTGAADDAPRRIEVAFVRELAPAAPPPVAPTTAPRTRRLAALAPDRAASGAEPREPIAPLPMAPPEPPIAQADLPALPEPPAPLAFPPAATAAAASAVAADAASAVPEHNPALAWPPSTRLSYRLLGNYRGPVEGQATVEWLRAGLHYQVVMDLGIGPSFAPLISRRVSSDGVITEQGLRPRRYDEITRALLREPRRQTIELDETQIRLPGGQTLPRPPGVQDSASQFVQLTWLFTTRPALLQTGTTIEMPLALPRRVEPWLYDVLGTEPLSTPAGAVEAIHVKPRREARAGGDLTAEVWIAPSLQNLPVRILIRQDADTFLDLVIERLPQQAAAAAGASAASR